MRKWTPRHDLTGVTLKTLAAPYRGQKLRGVVIAAVDSMTVRQEIWKRVRLDRDVALLIDPRMGAEVARIYSVRPTDPDGIAFYDENLYTAQEAERLPCSARAIIYCPTIIGGIIALIVKAHALGQPLRREILFDLPVLKLIAN